MICPLSVDKSEMSKGHLKSCGAVVKKQVGYVDESTRGFGDVWFDSSSKNIAFPKSPSLQLENSRKLPGWQ